MGAENEISKIDGVLPMSSRNDDSKLICNSPKQALSLISENNSLKLKFETRQTSPTNNDRDNILSIPKPEY
jgi:hypothetical protein